MFHRQESSISIETGVSVRSQIRSTRMSPEGDSHKTCPVTPIPVNLPSEAECPSLNLSGGSSPTENPGVSVGSPIGPMTRSKSSSSYESDVIPTHNQKRRKLRTHQSKEGLRSFRRHPSSSGDSDNLTSTIR